MVGSGSVAREELVVGESRLQADISLASMDWCLHGNVIGGWSWQVPGEK